MKIQWWLSIVLIAAAWTSVTAQEDKFPKRDGNWWLTLQSSVQSNYTLGLMDGLQAAGWLEIQAMEPTAYEKMQQQQDEKLKGITNLELAHNLTALYRDHPEWRDIRVSSGIWLALMRIRGMRDEQLRDVVATIRQHTEH